MACSKIFSGDLPEISIYIIQNLRNNFNTLYSLVLVNRFWCRLAIPLLWEDPFSIKYRKHLTFHFLNTYFLFLNDNDKYEVKKILPYGFDSKSKLKHPLFNYPSLIKTIDFTRIRLHVSNWISYTTSISIQQSSNKPYFPLTSIDYEFHAILDYRKNNVVYFGLINLFIENNASLNNLCMEADTPIQCQLICDICDMILKNPKFFSELSNFGFYQPTLPLGSMSLSSLNINYKSLKVFLSSLPSSIKHMDCNFQNVDFKNNFANAIQSQSQLSSITFSFQAPLLDLLKCHSNTLTSINFSSCTFSNIKSFDTLSYLTKLESLQFKYCDGLNSKVIQPLLNITTSLKIKTLVFIENRFSPLLTTEVSTSIQLLVQKIGSYIEILILNIREDELRRKLFEAIIDFCEKVKFLHLGYIKFINIPQLSKIIFKLNNYLKYLTLEIAFYTTSIFSYDLGDNKEELKTSSMILKELTKSLPPSLHYLDLSLAINPNDLRIAFENCNQVELKRLLIRDENKNNEGTTLKVIRDFVKEKNIEFLSYSIGLLCGQEIRHRSLENLVEEIQTFIKMIRYNDLVIKVSDTDGTLMIAY